MKQDTLINLLGIICNFTIVALLSIYILYSNGTQVIDSLELQDIASVNDTMKVNDTMVNHTMQKALLSNIDKNIENIKVVLDKKLKNHTLVVMLFASVLFSMIVILITTNRKLRTTIEHYQNSLQTLIIEDVADIYKDVDKKISNKRRNHSLTIDIIAYTLYQLTSRIDAWRKDGKLHNITLNLYHLDEDFIENSPHINTNWIGYLHANKKIILEYIAKNGAELQKNNVKINFYSYSHLPAIHGIRIGETIYVSVALWDENGYLRSSEKAEYIKVPSNNQQPLSVRLRDVFQNWVDASKEISST